MTKRSTHSSDRLERRYGRFAVAFDIPSTASIVPAFESTLAKLKKTRPKIFLSRQTVMDIKAAFVEAVANAIKHAGELRRQGKVTGRLFLDDRAIGFDIIDHGPGYDPDTVALPDLTDLKATGRGVFMMKQLGDSLKYRKGKTKNVLEFKRNLIGQDEGGQGLDLLYELSEAIIRHASLDEVYQIILGRALDLFHVERASILIYDEKKKGLKVVASRGISSDVRTRTLVRPGEGVSGYVYQHGRPLLIEDIESNRRGIEKKNHYKTGSFISAPMICSPLRLEEKSLGVINLTDRIDGKKFTKRDLKLLSTIANQAMACLYIRGLVDEIKETEGLKREMEQVRLIQSSYLPREAPKIAGYDLAGRCEMGQSVGGDYFDYFVVDSKLYLVVADVSGHDMKSAVTMVNFRSRLKALLPGQQDPATILGLLNSSLFEDLQKFEQFVSCLLVRMDTASGDFEMANAGHYPPLFYSGRLWPGEPGIVIGVSGCEVYQNTKGTLAPGEGMLLYTDGVIESLDENERMFGMDRLRKALADNTGRRAQQLVDYVVESVLAFRRSEGILDDVTVMAVARREG